MLTAYSTSIITAVVVLLVIGIFAAIPWLIYSYRKYGFLSLWQTIVIVSFIFYALSAYFLVILPLPEVRDTCAMQGVDARHVQLVPFYFLSEMFQGSPIVLSQPATYIHLIKHPSFLPAFLNVLILFPLGIYMRYFRGDRFTVKRMMFTGFLVSLFFEITQLTGLYGIYNCPYRVFNVDDLMLNTLGAVGGYIVAPALLILFPSKERVKEKASRIFQEKTVRPTAQLLALLIDYIVVMMSWFIVSMLLRMYDPMTKMLFMLLGFFVLQYLMPLYTRGKTLGTRLLRFHFAKNYNERWAKVLFRRWIALVAPWFIYKLIHFIIKYATLDMNLPYYAFQIFLELGLSLLIFLMLLIIVIHGATVLMSRQDKPFYFDELSGVIARYDQR